MDFSTLDARKQLAGKYSVKYGLETALVCGLIEQESSWNCWSMRYEPLFFTHYIQPLLNTNQVHDMTEATARATSYGLTQVLGQVARELGFQGRFLTELCDPDIGVDFGCRKLKKCFEGKSNTWTEHDALLCYNGGGEEQYPHMVIDRKRKYQ